MLSIKNNVMAENAAQYVAQSYDALGQSVQRLSSGLRINGASDDAAGLAIRELMRSDITVMQQASRNAQDAVSMLQTGDGALQAVDNILVRMKELAEQSATGSYTDTQRSIINDEFQQMGAEIGRIAGSTSFNGITMLNSASGTVTIQVGTGNTTSDQITVNLADTTVAGLKLDNVKIDSQTGAAAALAKLDSAIALKDAARAQFGYKINRLENTLNVLNIQTENLQTAESRISDVDVASEMSTMTRNQILTQAGVAMLAQANSMPQLALKLLGA
jgi:flagellin